MLPDTLQTAIRSRFGLKIPIGALDTIIRRAKRAGYVTYDERAQLHVRNVDALRTLDFDRKRERASKAHDVLTNALAEFAHARHNEQWTTADADKHFSDYLRSHSLAASARAESSANPSKATVIVGGFVVDLHENDRPALAALDTVVRGSVLADVLYTPEFFGSARRIEDMTACLDSRFVMYLLKYAGEARRRPASELVKLLQKDGVRVTILEHNRREIEAVLEAIGRALDEDPATVGGEVGEYFVEANFTASDVALLHEQLDDELNRLGIEVISEPPTEARIDEERLGTMLRSAARSYADPKRPHLARNDIKSLRAVHQFRRGHPAQRLEGVRAILVTTNAVLARVSATFFGEVSSDTPHCILDSPLTTRLWLRRPVDSPELPRARIIADCYAALDPKPTTWRKYLQEIDRLRNQGDLTEQDVALLRYSVLGRRTFVEVTYNDPAGVGIATVREALRRSLEAARADLQAELDEERRASVALRGELETARAQSALDRTRVENLATRLSRLEGRKVPDPTHVVSQGIAAVFVRLAARLLFVVLLIALVLGITGGVHSDWPLAAKVIAWAVLTLGVLVTALLAQSGESVSAVVRRFQTPIQNTVRRQLARLPIDQDVGPDVSDPAVNQSKEPSVVDGSANTSEEAAATPPTEVVPSGGRRGRSQSTQDRNNRRDEDRILPRERSG